MRPRPNLRHFQARGSHFHPWLLLLAGIFAVLSLACGSAQTPPPRISSFAASSSIITEGTSTSLTATFLNGTGSIDQGVGSVRSGEAKATGNLAADTTFTLTVSGNGEPLTQSLTITVVAPALQPVITAPAHVLSGATGLSASVPEQAGCTFEWNISGGVITAGAATPTVTYTAGTSGYVVLSCVATNAAGSASNTGMGISAIEPTGAAPVLTAPSIVTASTAGYTASAPLQGGCSYAWTISGGTITAGDATYAITFTPGSTGSVLLSCIVTDANGIPSFPASALCTIVAAPMAPSLHVDSSLTARVAATASVDPQVGCTYLWTLKGGSISGASTGSSLAFTPYAKTPLQLGCQVVNAAGGVSAQTVLSLPVTFTEEDVRIELGLNSPPARKGADGKELAVGKHPFGNALGDVVNMQRIDEVHLVTALESSKVTGRSVKLYTKLDDSDALVKLDMPDLPDMTDRPFRVPVVADTNGDGKQDVIYVGPNDGFDDVEVSAFNVSRIKAGATRAAESLGTVAITPFKFRGTDSSSYSDHVLMRSLRNLHQQIDVAAGDIDGDGKDEVVFTAGRSLYVIRINADSTLTRLWVRDFSLRTDQILRVECADLDRDGKAEIILTEGERTQGQNADLYVLKWDTTTGVLKTALDGQTITTSGKTLRCAEVKVGDLDADGTPEIVVAGLLSDKREICTMVLHVTAGSSVWTASFVTAAFKTDDLNAQVWKWFYDAAEADGQDWTLDRAADAAVPGLALADLKGDGTLQIASFDSLLAYDGETLEYAFTDDSQNLFMGEVIYSAHLGQIFNAQYQLPAANYWEGIFDGAPKGNRRMQTWYGQMIAGRFSSDPDAADEILLLDQRRANIRRFYYDSTAKMMKEAAKIPVPTEMRDDLPEYLCAADLNDDGTEIQYLGYETIFTRPIILAALASPPFWGITKENQEYIQQTGNSLTQFGKSIGSSIGASVKWGSSVGVALGEKATVPVVGNGSVEDKTTLKFSADFSVDVDAAYELGISYETYAGTDAVLFSSVPVDCYVYQVTKVGPGNQHVVGEKVVYQRTRKAQLQFTDVQFFNEHNGDYPDIDTTIFKHTVGRPLTYLSPGEAALKAILEPQQWFLMENIGCGIVPRGNLYNTMSYSTSVSAGASAEFTFEVEHESEASFGVLVGYSASGKIGIAIRTTTTFGESISGSVGGLDGDFYKPEYMYNWGIVSYVDAIWNEKYPISYVNENDEVVFNFPFKVINYWVQQ